MTGISRTIEVTLHPTAKELADMLWDMDERQQAVFFNRLGEVSGAKLCFQLQWVTDSGLLTDDGRHAMGKIGEYSQESKT